MSKLPFNCRDVLKTTEIELEVFERCEASLRETLFELTCVDDQTVSSTVGDLGSRSVTVEYSLSVAPGSPGGVYMFEPNPIGVGKQASPVESVEQIEAEL
jgi:hypothetical protein